MPGARGASAPDKRRRRRWTHPGNNSRRRILYVYAWASSGCYWSPAVCRWDVNTVSFNGKLQSIAAAVSRCCEGGRKKGKRRHPAVIKSAHAGGGHSPLWNIVTGINSWVKSVGCKGENGEDDICLSFNVWVFSEGWLCKIWVCATKQSHSVINTLGHGMKTKLPPTNWLLSFTVFELG